MMKILVACEESQAVTIELRKLGHEAYSCDIVESSGGRPEWHLMQDVVPLLKEKWDMIIAFPPCTHLAVSGAAHFEKKRKDGRQRESIEFFMQFINADCEKIAVENPVNIISGEYIKKWFPDLYKKYNLPLKPTQTIQPYEFGHEARKKTCLWLKGLPILKPTQIVGMGDVDKTGHSVGASSTFARDENGKILSWNDPRTGKIRSKTFLGIAKAMAEQWGSNLKVGD
jgi:hypothetical protein